jgi:competence protein ComEC
MSPETCRSFARPLAPVVLALAAGIAAPAWGCTLPLPWLPAGLLALLAAMLLMFALGRRARLLPLVFFGLLGMALHQQARYPVFPPHHVVNLPQDQVLTLSGHLYHPSKTGAGGVQLFLEAEARRHGQGWQPAAGKVLLSAPPMEPPTAGARLVVKGRLREPAGLKNPGAFDRARFLAADGIFRELRLRDAEDLVFLAAGRPPLRERLRGGIRRLLKELPSKLGAIYLAMLLGDQGEITPEIRQALARTGTSHLLVVNGLHLSMVAAVVYFLIFWSLRRFPWLLLRLNAMKAATLGAAAAVAGYAWVAGGSPSTQRAEVMVLAYLLLVFLGRPRELWSALALAALVILVMSPLRLFSISFQLSFAAVAAIVYLVPRWVGRDADDISRPPWHIRAWFRLKEWLAASAAASLATAPLVAAYFQVVSILGILVNAVAIPLVLLLALPLGESAVLAQALSLTPVAKALLFLGKFPLWLGYAAISGAARLPGAAVITPVPTIPQICLFYFMVFLVFAPRRSFLTWGGAAAAALALAGTVALPLARPVQALEVTCLDTRGGLAGIAVAPPGRRLVFSAPEPSWPGKGGGGRGILPPYCHWRQFRRLDQVAALGLSRGNARELLNLARQFTVGQWWYGHRGPPGQDYWELWNFLGDRDITPRSLERGNPPGSLGEAEIRFPSPGRDREPVLLLGYQGRQVLVIPPSAPWGDWNGAGLPPRVDVLIAPGFLKDSARNALLERFKPERVVIYGNSRGLPLEPSGWPFRATPYFTRNGAVSIFLDAAGVTVGNRNGT